MSDTIKKDPLGAGRLPDESVRAYRAFCVYCDLGPDRSLDRAWGSFCAQSNPGRMRESARRPGHWATWSQEYQWVNRAQTHDDEIDEARRQANFQRLRRLEENRFECEIEDQEQIRQLLRLTNEKLKAMLAAPFMEVTRTSQDKDTGAIIKSKVRAFCPRDTAQLLKARNATSKQAIRGVRGTEELENPEEEEGVVNRITWDRPEDPENILAKELEQRAAARAIRDNIKKEKKKAAQAAEQALSDQLAEKTRISDQASEELDLEEVDQEPEEKAA
jgi:hypothetical protein